MYDSRNPFESQILMVCTDEACAVHIFDARKQNMQPICPYCMETGKRVIMLSVVVNELD